MKLVEIIRSLNTSNETLNKIKKIVKSIGKEYVEVKECPGFIVNRILIPMINEAVSILGDSLATKENIDKAMIFGANHPIGPLALADIIGIDICLNILEFLTEETGNKKYKPDPLLKKMVDNGYLGKKSGKGFYKY
jgi:3-hydroxybutyryl-CoA dehydrogenase